MWKQVCFLRCGIVCSITIYYKFVKLLYSTGFVTVKKGHHCSFIVCKLTDCEVLIIPIMLCEIFPKIRSYSRKLNLKKESFKQNRKMFVLRMAIQERKIHVGQVIHSIWCGFMTAYSKSNKSIKCIIYVIYESIMWSSHYKWEYKKKKWKKKRKNG